VQQNSRIGGDVIEKWCVTDDIGPLNLPSLQRFSEEYPFAESHTISYGPTDIKIDLFLPVTEREREKVYRIQWESIGRSGEASTTDDLALDVSFSGIPNTETSSASLISWQRTPSTGSSMQLPHAMPLDRNSCMTVIHKYIF